MAQSLPKGSARESWLERAVSAAFRRGGWRIIPEPNIAGASPDLLVRRGNHQYVVEIKSSAEARRDRLVPLLAQAILQARAAASKVPRARPLAVVGAANLSESLIDELRSFAAEVAPDVSIGIVDVDGSRVFVGRDVEALSHVVPRSKGHLHHFRNLASHVDLFSDLNQWMLKVLLAPRIPDNLLSAPRERLQSVSDLAKAANVSLMSASRCVNLLRREGFIDESHILQVVNVEALLDRWRAASRKSLREVPMRWVIPGDARRQLSEAVRGYLKRVGAPMSAPRGRHQHGAGFHPRMSVGLFAAADMLGFKVVRGVPAHLYLERLDSLALESLGLVPVAGGKRAEVFIRVPAFRESIYRPAVMRDGIPVCDVIQVWLDVADHPARGAQQAEEIWRRVLLPLWKRSRT